MLEEKLKKEHMPFKPTIKHSDLPEREVQGNASSNNEVGPENAPTLL